MTERVRLAEYARFAAIVAGLSYILAVSSPMNGPFIIVWKGLGVGLLAVFAALQADSRAGWQIAAVLALGAAGDVVLELDFPMGAALFALGHCVAIHLYWSHRRANWTGSQMSLAVATLFLPPLIAWGLTGRADVVLYTLLLSLMAAAAWLSRFPRLTTGIGAMMFVASDLLIFARMGPLEGVLWASLGVWVLYFGGQYLIATGVTRALKSGLVSGFSR